LKAIAPTMIVNPHAWQAAQPPHLFGATHAPPPHAMHEKRMSASAALDEYLAHAEASAVVLQAISNRYSGDACRALEERALEHTQCAELEQPVRRALAPISGNRSSGRQAAPAAKNAVRGSGSFVVAPEDGMPSPESPATTDSATSPMALAREEEPPAPASEKHEPKLVARDGPAQLRVNRAMRSRLRAIQPFVEPELAAAAREQNCRRGTEVAPDAGQLKCSREMRRRLLSMPHGSAYLRNARRD
jgi:hypothetical protein